MWLRRQDELNEARPTERFSTAIRLLSGRAGMERRYAKDLRARSTDEGERDAVDRNAVTDSVDVRSFAMPPTRRQVREEREPEVPAPVSQTPPESKSPSGSASTPASAQKRAPGGARREQSSQAAAARAQRSKVLARRRRTTVMLFVAFTLGAVVAAVGGLAFLWAPAVPAVLLSGYIGYLRTQERRRFACQMDRRRAEVAAQRLRERQRRGRAPLGVGGGADEPEEGPEAETDPGLAALAADRRALVEQTDHAEWVDQQRERRQRPGHGDSWDPVPVPLPTYVTAPVAPRATSDVDLGAPDAWSSARSSSVAPRQESAPVEEDGAAEDESAEDRSPADGRSEARRAASARRSRERGRTPLFDQYAEGDRPRAANE
jgi:hypothetical protein